jgi:hypothetical protein
MRTARRFLLRIAGQMLSMSGTIQIGNRAAEYNIRDMSGSLNECKFTVQLHLLGNLFLLRGAIHGGRVSWTNIFQADDSGRLREIDMRSAAKIFGVDPELWVKRAIKDAIVRSVGPGVDLDQMVVVDGEIVDSSSIPSESVVKGPTSVPMPEVRSVLRRTSRRGAIGAAGLTKMRWSTV